MSNEKKRPVSEVSVSTASGAICAAIWRNESQGKVFYNTTFELRYQDKDGEWKSGESYGPMDLLALAKCADLAFNKIVELKQQDKETGAAADAA